MTQSVLSWRPLAYAFTLSACLTPLAALPANARTASNLDDALAAPSSSVQVQTAPPPGFEGLTDEVDTLFDVNVQGRRIGSYRAVLANGVIRFSNPDAISQALEGVIRYEAALSLLSQPLDLNEQYRCFSGQTVGCGLLPSGMVGAIVDPQRFSVELFFSAADAIIEQRPALTLGQSSSTGLTLVQGVGLSFSSADFFGGEFEYGGALDTLLSVGRSAFVAQTLLSNGDGGTRLNQAHAQHIWSDRITRGGLIENYSTSLLSNYRIVGADFGVFTSPLQLNDQLSATPLDVVLPRDADVELRRNGVLLSVRRYAAGPQRIDTSTLPNGSYQVAITARADGVVVIDEVRSFSKAGGLPPEGKTDFNVGVGLYVPDRRSDNAQAEDFLPYVQNDSLVVSGRIARRIGSTSGAELNLLSIDGETFGEVSFRSIFSNAEGIAAIAGGSDGSYGISLTGNVIWNDMRFSLTARSNRTDDPTPNVRTQNPRYRAFYRSEDSFLASAQFLVAGGSLNLSGAYSRGDGFEDRYGASIRYSRSVQVVGRRAFLNAYAQTTDLDTRVGFTLAFGFGAGQRVNGTASLGLEQVSTDAGGVRSGLSPVANLNIARRDEWADITLTSQAGLSTNADNDRLHASTVVMSNLGAVEVTAQHIRTEAGDFSTLYGNLQSGFAIGGGAAKFGMSRLGEAVVIAEIDAGDVASGRDGLSSGYRVRVDSQPTELLRPGARSALGLPAYAEYEVTLTPENAPPFDADLTIRRITLYPGNVVRLKFDAQREYTLFGQLIGVDGTPLEGVMLRSGADMTVTDDLGYFTVTARADGQIEFRPTDQTSCAPITVSSVIDLQNATKPFHRLGRIECR